MAVAAQLDHVHDVVGVVWVRIERGGFESGGGEVPAEHGDRSRFLLPRDDVRGETARDVAETADVAVACFAGVFDPLAARR